MRSVTYFAHGPLSIHLLKYYGIKLMPYLTSTTLLIPVDFALRQIESVDVDASLAKLKQLHQQLILQALHQPKNNGLQVTDAIQLTLQDLCEVFAGRYADLVTSKGVEIIKRLYDECFLEIHRPPTPFPQSLIDYIAAEVCFQSPIDQPGSRLTDITENEFTYGRLFYLFESLVGTKQGEVTLKLCGKPVTRKIRKAYNDYETTFIWENDACRTQTISAHK